MGGQEGSLIHFWGKTHCAVVEDRSDGVGRPGVLGALYFHFHDSAVDSILLKVFNRIRHVLIRSHGREFDKDYNSAAHIAQGECCHI